MDLCVSCKGCKRDCPTGVDMARMKVEFLHHYKARHGHTLKDKLVAQAAGLRAWASRLGPALLNLRNRSPCWRAWANSGWAFRPGAACRSGKPGTFFNTRHDTVTRTEVLAAAGRWCCSWTPSTAIFEDRQRQRAIRVLQAGGYTVHVATKTVADGKHLCCGRTYLSSGMVDEARAKARELIDSLLPFAAQGIAIVGLEPSCLLTLRDEALTMGLGEAAHTVSRQALLLEEFLGREAAAGQLEDLKSRLRPATQPILLHGHCHQKAFDAVRPILDVIRLIPGAMPELIESSCCGMAGSFGYEARTHRGLDADGRTEPAACRAKAARCIDGGRWYQLPAPDPRRRAARGCACGAPAGRSFGPLIATESSCGASSMGRHLKLAPLRA
jgi:Fe-S oxidoreductase